MFKVRLFISGQPESCVIVLVQTMISLRQCLASNVKYSQFLQAFDVDGEKGIFPYEYLDSINYRLEKTRLPLPEISCWSSLKNKYLLKQNSFKQETFEYRYLESIWDKHNMKSPRNFLV